MGQIRDNYEETKEKLIQRAVSDAASPFGCCNFFDLCGDGDLMSLHYRGELGLLDLMNFAPTDTCLRKVEFISYVRPQMDGSTPTASYISDYCADPNGIEYGSCELDVSHFGYLGRKSKQRNVQIPERYCATSPRYRIDGTPVARESEWDMLFTMDALMDDVRRILITGNSATPGQFDGLQRWVRDGYTQCGGPTNSLLDSIIINWNSNPMSGGAGITYNGSPVGATFDIVDILLAANRRINQRIGWSPVLRSQNIRPGQKVLVMPTDWIDCLLNFYTCWSVCRDGQTVDSVNLDSLEARDFRRGLEGGMFGDGEIMLGREIIPILGYDWELINDNGTADMYLLTLGVGTQRFWFGDLLDANNALANINALRNDMEVAGGYFSTDGGRILGKQDFVNLCQTIKLWITLRLFTRAPWANMRIQNVACSQPLGVLSPDPLSGYFPASSFSSITCP